MFCKLINVTLSFTKSTKLKTENSAWTDIFLNMNQINKNILFRQVPCQPCNIYTTKNNNRDSNLFIKHSMHNIIA